MFEMVVRHAKFAVISVTMLAASVSASGQSVSAGGTGQGQAPVQGQGQAQGAGAPAVKKLSVDEAVQMALEQNLSLQVERVNPQIQEMNIFTARSAWVPTLQSQFTGGNTTNPNYSRYGASGATVQTDSVNWNVGAGQALRTGGRYDVSWGANRQATNDLFQLTNPIRYSVLSGTFTQPFLRNFKIDAPRQQLMISKKNREMSDIQLRQTVLGTMRNVKNAYWDLAYQRANLEVQQESLNLANESLKNNQARVRIGTMAPIDIIQAEAEVASREESVIRAQAAVDQSEDRFRTLVMDPATPGFWNTKFELSDKANFQAMAIDLDAAVRRALDARTDLAQQRKGLEESDINLRYMKNQTMPDVNMVAKYSTIATGGTTLIEDGGSNDIGWGSVLHSLFRRDLPTWSLALNFSYPIGNSNAEANLARARLQYGQAQTQLRLAELNVTTQVRDTARQVQANQKRVESTRKSRELQERKLEAEQKKFAAGMQTTYFVLQAQRDLVTARNAELQAILDYTRSLIDFEMVQQAPVSGGSGGAIVVQ
ncbi:MAG: TolC family protein [Bacteroidales bacterium]